MAIALHEAGYPVSVINPQAIAASIRDTVAHFDQQIAQVKAQIATHIARLRAAGKPNS